LEEVVESESGEVLRGLFMDEDRVGVSRSDDGVRGAARTDGERRVDTSRGPECEGRRS
jgi:hypothetical protein